MTKEHLQLFGNQIDDCVVSLFKLHRKGQPDTRGFSISAESLGMERVTEQRIARIVRYCDFRGMQCEYHDAGKNFIVTIDLKTVNFTFTDLLRQKKVIEDEQAA